MAAKIEQYKKIRKAARSSAKKKAIVRAAEKVFGKKGFHQALSPKSPKKRTYLNPPFTNISPRKKNSCSPFPPKLFVSI